MAKRFIDTAIFRKDFIRGLDAPCKLLWLYLINECDHAGLWDVELEVAEIRLGVKLPKNAAEKLNGKIIPIDGGKKWFIPSFIDFQYGKLNPENRAHGAAILLLNKFNLLTEDNKIKPLTSPLQGAMDMDMVKELDTDKDKEKKPTSEKFNPCDLIPESWDQSEFSDLWAGFAANRIKAKKTLTPQSAKLNISQLVRYFPEWGVAKERLETAVMKGWQGLVFEDDKINSHQTPKNGKPVRDKF